MRSVGLLDLAQSRAKARIDFSSLYENVSSASHILDVKMITGSAGSPTVKTRGASFRDIVETVVLAQSTPC